MITKYNSASHINTKHVHGKFLNKPVKPFINFIDTRDFHFISSLRNNSNTLLKLVPQKEYNITRNEHTGEFLNNKRGNLKPDPEKSMKLIKSESGKYSRN